MIARGDDLAGLNRCAVLHARREARSGVEDSEGQLRELEAQLAVQQRIRDVMGNPTAAGAGMALQADGLAHTPASTSAFLTQAYCVILPLVAYALFVTAIIFGIATIANDNLQDLKTGQLVGATPWRQQVALVLGVLFGALVIPPILDLLNSTFGFQGAPGAGENALSAPQAALISAIAQGVLGGDLDWGLIGTGAAIGMGAILVDELLRKSGKGSGLSQELTAFSSKSSDNLLDLVLNASMAANNANVADAFMRVIDACDEEYKVNVA